MPPSFWRKLPLPRTLRRQFILALSVQALLIVAGALMAVYALRISAETSRQLAEERLEHMQEAQNMVESTLLLERESYRILNADSLDQMRAGYDESTKQMKRLDALVERLGRDTSDMSVLSLHQAGQLFRNTLNIVVSLHEQTLRNKADTTARQKQMQQLHNFHRQLQKQALGMVAAARQLSNRFSEDYRQTVKQLTAASAQDQKKILALLIGSLLLAWLVSRYFLGRQVVARLQQVSDYLRLGEIGDQPAQIPVQGTDEIGEMARAVEQFLENRRQLAATQDSLRRSEEMLRTVIETAPTAIIGLDLEGKVQAVWNRAAEQMLGWSAEEVMGHPLPTVSAENQEEFLNLCEQVREGVCLDGVEVQRHRRDGSAIDYSIYTAPLHDPAGNIAGSIAVLIDISAHKRLENEIRQRNAALETSNVKLEQAYNDLKAAQTQLLQQEKMASIGQLADGVAHEINNPMGFIISNLGTLEKYLARLDEFQMIQQQALERASQGNEEDLAALIEEVGRQAKRLKIDYLREDIGDLIQESLEGGERVKGIVQNLKSFARLDEQEWKPADINAALDSTLNIVWNELKYKANVHKDFAELPLTQCNVGQLNQVFMNLLVNAAQAIEHHGEIRVATRAEKSWIIITISDTGSGIPAEDLNRIFEPFYTSKEVGKGTGLGLSIAYDIIKKHEGKIDVDSEVGMGTTFTIRLPLKDG